MSHPLRAASLGAALAAIEAGQMARAGELAGAWLARNDTDQEASLLLGLALAGQGLAQRAAPLLHGAALARPGFAHPCRDLARLRPDAPDLVEAQFRACRALDPTHAGLGYAHADFRFDQADPAGCAALLRDLLPHAPGFAPAENLLGMALVELGEIEGAILAFHGAIGLDPGQAAVWSNLGSALKILGRFEDAMTAHDRALALAPHDPMLRQNRAVTLLRAGRMAEAWPDYEARLAGRERPGLPPARMLPQLDGLDLAGRTILAWHEEGFGDTLQFCRFLPLLAARGARVLAALPRELARLLSCLDGVEILHPDAALPPFEYHVPMFSLPRAFATTLATIPARIPYLRPDSALVASWAPLLPQGELRVGLVWAGQARPWVPSFTMLDGRRSMALANLAPLAEIPGLALVSLQKGPASAQAGGWPGTLHDPMPLAEDFADTAAIIANLDLVVSVDTAVLHLAAALGKPTILLDRHDSCWRWLDGRIDSPWYRSLRIIRQERPGDWAPVVARAAGILAAMAGAPSLPNDPPMR